LDLFFIHFKKNKKKGPVNQLGLLILKELH